MTTISATITARALFALIKPFGPTVDGMAVVFDSDLQGELESAMSILHTGVRAILAGRPWWGSTARRWSGSADHIAKRPKVEVLDLDKPIPPWCGLLSVEGDNSWDRIDPAARIDHPELFVLFAPVAAGVRGS